MSNERSGAWKSKRGSVSGLQGIPQTGGQACTDFASQGQDQPTRDVLAPGRCVGHGEQPASELVPYRAGGGRPGCDRITAGPRAAGEPPSLSWHILQGAAGMATHSGGQVQTSRAGLRRRGEPRHQCYHVLTYNELFHQNARPLWKQNRKHEAHFFQQMRRDEAFFCSSYPQKF